MGILNGREKRVTTMCACSTEVFNKVPCNLDVLGDTLEKAGVDPGCIFEFHHSMGDDLEPGGVVQSNQVPGVRPTRPQHIQRVLVMQQGGGIVSMTLRTPLVLAHLRRILQDLV